MGKVTRSTSYAALWRARQRSGSLAYMACLRPPDAIQDNCGFYTWALRSVNPYPCPLGRVVG